MDHLPNKLLCYIFQYLKRYDLIEASAVCIKWYSIIWDDIFCFKINETNNFFMATIDLIHFQRIRDSVYRECIGFLSHEKIYVVDEEILDRMFYSVLPFRAWAHFWFYYRSQEYPRMCQFCTNLQITNIKIINYVSKKLLFDARNLFPLRLNSTVVYVLEVSLFAHVRFGIDKQRPHSKKNCDVLQYGEISCPFSLFKNC